jgi:hypothetical protein
MTVPRRAVDRVPIKRYASLFPVTEREAVSLGTFVRPRVEEVPPTLVGYDLLPLEIPSGIKGCDEPTTPCALNKIALRADLRTPENILKASLFPSAFVRMSVGLEPAVTAPDLMKFIEIRAAAILRGGVEVHELLALLSRKAEVTRATNRHPDTALGLESASWRRCRSPRPRGCLFRSTSDLRCTPCSASRTSFASAPRFVSAKRRGLD